jgi:hypothetical protein
MKTLFICNLLCLVKNTESIIHEFPVKGNTKLQTSKTSISSGSPGTFSHRQKKGIMGLASGEGFGILNNTLILGQKNKRRKDEETDMFGGCFDSGGLRGAGGGLDAVARE